MLLPRNHSSIESGPSKRKFWKTIIIYIRTNDLPNIIGTHGICKGDLQEYEKRKHFWHLSITRPECPIGTGTSPLPQPNKILSTHKNINYTNKLSGFFVINRRRIFTDMISNYEEFKEKFFDSVWKSGVKKSYTSAKWGRLTFSREEELRKAKIHAAAARFLRSTVME